jgi:hypothetical protein
MYYRQPQQILLASSVNDKSSDPADCHQALQYMNLGSVKHLNAFLTCVLEVVHFNGC